MTTKDTAGYTQAKAVTQPLRSGSTAAGRAFINAAIAVAEVRVRHAVDQADHEDAMRELGELQAQREGGPLKEFFASKPKCPRTGVPMAFCTCSGPHEVAT